MAQFDVHANRGAYRAEVPFVVLVQSSLFDDYRRRVVVPLMRRDVLPGRLRGAGTRLNPVFTVNGVQVVLHPLDMVSVDMAHLGPKAGSLADDGQAITDALDELFTRAWN
jgi:toxin CcdB